MADLPSEWSDWVGFSIDAEPVSATVEASPADLISSGPAATVEASGPVSPSAWSDWVPFQIDANPNVVRVDSRPADVIVDAPTSFTGHSRALTPHPGDLVADGNPSAVWVTGTGPSPWSEWVAFQIDPEPVVDAAVEAAAATVIVDGVPAAVSAEVVPVDVAVATMPANVVAGSGGRSRARIVDPPTPGDGDLFLILGVDD